jgi:cytochrome b involved in lipid metabolism
MFLTSLRDIQGGLNVIMIMVGKDATTAFFGGVYHHSNTAYNVRFSNHYGERP